MAKTAIPTYNFILVPSRLGRFIPAISLPTVPFGGALVAPAHTPHESTVFHTASPFARVHRTLGCCRWLYTLSERTVTFHRSLPFWRSFGHLDALFKCNQSGVGFALAKLKIRKLPTERQGPRGRVRLAELADENRLGLRRLPQRQVDAGQIGLRIGRTLHRDLRPAERLIGRLGLGVEPGENRSELHAGRRLQAHGTLIRFRGLALLARLQTRLLLAFPTLSSSRRWFGRHRIRCRHQDHGTQRLQRATRQTTPETPYGVIRLTLRGS